MKKLAVFSALAVLMVLTSTASAGGDKNRGEIGAGDTYENACPDQPCYETAPKPGASDAVLAAAAPAAAELDEAEVAHLLFIREEEKMARDVYLVLYETWRSPVFANIAGSEQAHMDAMKNLLDFYGIPDPVDDDTVGAFNNAGIGELYLRLVESGATSETYAFLVGGYIEEYDIIDLWKAYEETDEDRIKTVYQNLYEGSYNHLDAFVYNFEILTGETYTPQLLTIPEYDLVMAFATQAKQTQSPKQKKGK